MGVRKADTLGVVKRTLSRTHRTLSTCFFIHMVMVDVFLFWPVARPAAAKDQANKGWRRL